MYCIYVRYEQIKLLYESKSKQLLNKFFVKRRPDKPVTDILFYIKFDRELVKNAQYTNAFHNIFHFILSDKMFPLSKAV